MPAPHQITPAQLNRLIGTAECPEIVDVCIDEDFAKDPHLTPGSCRHGHTIIPSLIIQLKATPAVTVCQKCRKLSQGVAAWLRSEGPQADHLQGGIYGWRDATGLSRQFKADQARLAAGFTLHDALYRWARHGQGEIHGWPDTSGAAA